MREDPLKLSRLSSQSHPIQYDKFDFQGIHKINRPSKQGAHITRRGNTPHSLMCTVRDVNGVLGVENHSPSYDHLTDQQQICCSLS